MSEQLFERWAKNPRKRVAFEAWFKSVYPSLFKKIFSMTNGNREVSEDLLHDVAVKFLDGGMLAKMVSSAATQKYFLVSATNLWRDQLKHTRNTETLGNYDEVDLQSAPLDYLLLEERISSLERELDSEEIVILRYLINGASLSEIAKNECITYSNAGVRVHRIRNKINNLVNI